MPATRRTRCPRASSSCCSCYWQGCHNIPSETAAGHSSFSFGGRGVHTYFFLAALDIPASDCLPIRYKLLFKALALSESSLPEWVDGKPVSQVHHYFSRAAPGLPVAPSGSLHPLSLCAQVHTSG